MTRSFIFKTLYPLCLGVSNLVEIGSVGLEKMLKMFKIYGQTKGGNISSKVHPNSAQMSEKGYFYIIYRKKTPDNIEDVMFPSKKKCL